MERDIEKKSVFYTIEIGAPNYYTWHFHTLVKGQPLDRIRHLFCLHLIFDDDSDYSGDGGSPNQLVFSYINQIKSLNRLILGLGERLVAIKKGDIPSTVSRLHIYFKNPEESKDPSLCQMTLEEGTIPDSVTHLTIEHSLIKHNTQRLIPDSVEKLIYLNFKLDDGDHCNWPPNIRSIKLTDSFNRKSVVSSLPNGLYKLHLQIPLDIAPGLLPQSIRELMIYEIGKPLEIGSLPMGLENLGYYKFESVRIPSQGVIPDSVKSFYLYSWSISQDLEPQILDLSQIINPETTSLQCLQVKIVNSINFVLDFQDNTIPLTKEMLPSSLLELNLHRGTSRSKPFPYVPKSCTNLLFHVNDPWMPEAPIGWIPEGCKHLKLTSFLDLKIELYFPNGVFPPQLYELDLSNWKQVAASLLDVSIPDSVRVIKLPLFYYIKEKRDNFYQLVSDLFLYDNVEMGRREIEFKTRDLKNTIKLLSTDPLDQYIYFNISSEINEGFVLKSEIFNFLNSILKTDDDEEDDD
eukprot:gene8451-10381_t